MENKTKNKTRYVVTVALAAASIECGKLALMALPNIEVVSLLVALYGYILGFGGVSAALIFVFIEPLLFGFGPWFVTYLIYWPSLAALFWLLGALRVKNRIAITSAAVLMTAFFGVFSSFVDLGLFSGFFDNFFERFAVYYVSGVPFYLAEIITNLVLFPILFRPLSEMLSRILK